MKTNIQRHFEQNLIDIKSDGSIRLNQKYFDYSTGFKMVNHKFNFIQKLRIQSKIDKFAYGYCSSIQNVHILLLKLLKSLKDQYEISNLCLAGGCNLCSKRLIQKKNG